jgi:hypothetical protein
MFNTGSNKIGTPSGKARAAGREVGARAIMDSSNPPVLPPATPFHTWQLAGPMRDHYAAPMSGNAPTE